MRIGLPKFEFHFRDKYFQVSEPILWLSVNTSYEGDSLLPKDMAILNCLERKKKPYIFVKDAYISSWDSVPKDSSGAPVKGAPIETKFGINVYSSRINFKESPFPLINTAKFTGYVNSANDDGWMYLQCGYRSTKNKEIKYRTVPILNPSTYNPSIIGKKVYVDGSTCARSPGREDRLYVVANNLIILDD